MKLRKLAIATGLAVAIGSTASSLAFAQEMGQGGGMGPGMMGGGMGPGMMGGGMGPGMMGGGMGPGMMGGGMGPGMMGGSMGPGMMGGGMMPCPMMESGKGMMLMLEPEQRIEMRELMRDHRPAQFERMGQLMNLRDDLMEAMHSERPDPDEVQAIHAQMAELHGEMMAEMVRMRNAMHDLMTDEQRQQLQQAAPETDAEDDHAAHH
ncbi:Spy/CpxP family protein refolding chaperone [Billgrantia kenyensis]|uniref:Spy/CpxP family protein refolding chaperone n=1 Tax=Billgrantia kenyensis TaxID=321266 RepID=A0A7V9W210_9GAMM|nr:Spy/CpxP family protein refolding chaperone [Halomonas kenyensis]MBA2779572.1 Spy/CpxP family protein refolding chaperone [Halomonas kenyensis]MCG6662284.1 Spy/CpxP family protein refolding chaperone [Halomonas kenyensis]